MNEINNILNLLYDRKYVNNYVKLLKSCTEGIITRNQEKLNTVACRLWQLQYCIFYYIYNRNKMLLQNSDFLHILCAVYNKIFIDINSPLYKFILLNTITAPIQYISFTKNHDFKQHIINNVNTYCCIYGINKNTGIIQQYGVVHYLTIINDKHGNYYITSSYGSDNVCIPYQIEKLESLDEFILFCECLQYTHFSESEQHNKCIIDFMNKYFLKGGIKKRWSPDWIEERPELRHLWIDPQSGKINESEYIIHNTVMNFDIAIITNYQELVEKELLQNIETDRYISESVTREINKKIKKDNQKRYKKLGGPIGPTGPKGPIKKK
jgi:hypothetical protein